MPSTRYPHAEERSGTVGARLEARKAPDTAGAMRCVPSRPRFARHLRACPGAGACEGFPDIVGCEILSAKAEV